MLKNITLSAEETLIQKARERAKAGRTTLNSLFRKWLKIYTGDNGSPDQFNQLMDDLSYANPGRTFTREQMNER